MSTTYDWSPVFGQNGAISNYLQNMQYQKQLQAMMGKEDVPGIQGQQQTAQLPQMPMQPQIGGYGGGSMSVGDKPAASQLPPQIFPGNQVTNRVPGYQPTMSPVNAGGGSLDISTPNIAPQTTYSGPVGQALGDQQSSALMPFLQSLGPRGLPMLMQTTQNAMQHKQDLEDRRITPMSDQEAQALNLRKGGSYGWDAAHNPVTIQASDIPSEGAIKAKEDETTFSNQLPMNAYQQATVNDAQNTAKETARHNKQEEYNQQHPPNPLGGNGAVDKNGQPVTGDAYLATLPPGAAAQVKAIANYRQAPPMNRTSKEGIAVMNAVNQYNPSYDASQYGSKVKARNDFTTGKNGNTVRSLNVAISHLDTLGSLSDALDNGNVQLANSIGQHWSQQTGGPAPTNFDAAKQIVGDEIVKAIVGTGGAQQDRDKAAAAINRANSPAQLKGVIQTYQQLLGGQLKGLKQQYEKSTGLNDFEDYVSPEVRAKLQGGSANVAPAGNVIHYDAQGNRIK